MEDVIPSPSTKVTSITTNKIMREPLSKQYSIHHLISFSDFQDGGPSPPKMSLSFLGSFGNNSIHRESSINAVRQVVGLYKNFVLADEILKGSSKRERAFKTSGTKQLNHVRGTDGWFRSMLVIEVRLMIICGCNQYSSISLTIFSGSSH